MQKRGTNGTRTVALDNVYDLSNSYRLKHTEVSKIAGWPQNRPDYLAIKYAVKQDKGV